MPVARTYDRARRAVVTTLHDGYLDRLSRWSDIREYMPLLHETACGYEQVRVLELGARKGNSTLAFLAAAEKAGGHVTSVDLSPAADDRLGMAPWSKNPAWTFIIGDDMEPSVQSLLPAQVDVLFVDTSHEYEHTLAECRAHMPRVVPGGTALFHDTISFPDVMQALDAYCEETGTLWEHLPGTYGMGRIRC